MAEGTQSDEVIFSIKVDETNAETSTKRMVTTIQSLTEANKRLRAERNLVNLETKEGIAQIQKLNDAINKNNEMIKANISALEKQRLNIGNYKKEIQDALKEAGSFGAAINGQIDSLTRLANPLTAAVVGVGALGAIYLKSARGAEDFARAQNNINALLDEMANEVGSNGDSFLEKASRAFSIAAINLTSNTKADAEARKERLAIARVELETLRELDEEALTVAANRKKTEKEAEDARRVRDNSMETEATRLAAIATVEEKLKENEKERTGIIDRQVKAILSYGENVGSIKDGTLQIYNTEKKINFSAIESRDIRIQLRKLLAEQADIHEEINGKLTENVAAERSMTAEKLAQAKADREAAAAMDERVKAYVKSVTDSLPGAQEAAKQWAKDLQTTRLYDLRVSTSAEVKLVTDAATAMAKTRESLNKRVVANQQQSNAMVVDSYTNMFGALAGLLGAFGLRNKSLAIAQAGINTWLGVTEILKAPAAPFIEPMASITRGIEIATVIASGANAVRQISKAAGGGKFMTKGPTLLMVGDNPGGVERVTVEPISGKGQTKINKADNMVQMAGGGTLETVPTNYIETSMAASRTSIERNAMDIAEGIARNMPRQVLVVERVTELQQQQVEVRESAKV